MIARGDVDLRLENSSVDTHTNSYGIDEETIIYYYNGSKGYVAVGYDNMAKMIDADKAGSIDNGKVRASVVAFDDATDVAEVIVLYTDQGQVRHRRLCLCHERLRQVRQRVYLLRH